MVQANARHARNVANAVDARDLQEVKRIVDRAKLTRHEFVSVCDRLGFRKRNETDETKDGTCQGDAGEEAARATLLGGRPTAVEPTPAVATDRGAEPGAEDQVAPVVDPASLLGKVPMFFLDAEGRGGTTALALATIENDAETVRRLMKEVRVDWWVGGSTLRRKQTVNGPVSRSAYWMRWKVRSIVQNGAESFADSFLGAPLR